MTDTLPLRHRGRTRNIVVPRNADTLPVPWPDERAPEWLLTVKVKRDLDRRGLGLKVLGEEPKPHWAEGERGLAYRARGGQWWTVNTKGQL